MLRRSLPSPPSRRRARRAGRLQRVAHRYGTGRRDLADDREDDEAQDVVRDRRAEDDLPLPAREHLKFRQDPARDPDRGRGERRPREDRRQRGKPGRTRDEVAADERERHSDDGHGHRRAPHAHELVQVGLEPDLEEEEQDSDLCDEEDPGGERHEAEERRAEQDPDEELSQDRRLADPLSYLAEKLCPEKRTGEREEEGAELAVLHARDANRGETSKKLVELIGIEPTTS